MLKNKLNNFIYWWKTTDRAVIGRTILRYCGKLLLFIIAYSLCCVILFKFLPIPITPLMIQRGIEQKIEKKTFSFQKKWKAIDNISDNLILAVMCSEDQHFEEHSGFDFDAIEKAIESNKKRKKKGLPVQGASTISQQVAKNVFLLPTRSWFRKGIEVWFTMLIEIFWSKERIMEVYLNVVEMGDGVYGAEAAAQKNFHKNAINLRPSEAALIAAVLPNPRKWSPTNPTEYIQKRKNWILHQMAAWGGSIDLKD